MGIYLVRHWPCRPNALLLLLAIWPGCPACLLTWSPGSNQRGQSKCTAMAWDSHTHTHALKLTRTHSSADIHTSRYGCTHTFAHTHASAHTLSLSYYIDTKTHTQDHTRTITCTPAHTHEAGASARWQWWNRPMVRPGMVITPLVLPPLAMNLDHVYNFWMTGLKH